MSHMTRYVFKNGHGEVVSIWLAFYSVDTFFIFNTIEGWKMKEMGRKLLTENKSWAMLLTISLWILFKHHGSMTEIASKIAFSSIVVICSAWSIFYNRSDPGVNELASILVGINDNKYWITFHLRHLVMMRRTMSNTITRNATPAPI
jgi:hypothetical protein